MLGVRNTDPVSMEQYFTKPEVAGTCLAFLKTVIPCLSYFDLILEPSFGDGVFVRLLRENGRRLLYLDIDAKDPALRQNFLTEFVPPIGTKHAIAIGNPPFKQAVAFFNRAAEFCEVIAFVLPQSFRKSSIQNRLNTDFSLGPELELAPDSFTLSDIPYSVPTTFQIWSKKKKKRIRTMRKTRTADFEFVTPDRAELAIRRVGVNAGRIFTEHIATRSRQSHMFLHALDSPRTLKILISLDLEHIPEKYHTAGCPSISKTEICSLYERAMTPSPG